MLKVSIILTSYNHSNTIRQTIDGILKQTYSEFELIIWDDASSDESWDIIKSYTDPRIKSYRNGYNRNGVFGINESIGNIARGEYIAIHHSSDDWHKDKLKLQVQALDENKSVAAVFTNVEVIDKYSNKFIDDNDFYFDIFDKNNRTRHEWIRFFMTKGNALCHPSVLIRKSTFNDCGIYRNALVQTADFDLWLRICSKHEILILKDKLTFFRIESKDGNSSSHTKETETRSFYECYKIFSDFIPSINQSEWSHIFPEYVDYKSEGNDINKYIIARLLIDLDTMHPIKIIGLDMLFKLLQDNSLSLKLNKKYNFTHHDFIKLSYSIDPFYVAQVYELKTDLLFLKKEHKYEIESYISSHSWKITKPLRFIRRLLTYPREYLQIIKTKTKKILLKTKIKKILLKKPSILLPLMRKIQQKINITRNFIKDLPISTQNINYLNTVSLKRYKELLSESHIAQVTSNLSNEKLPDIDITIVTYNNGAWVKRFFESLVIQGYPCIKLNLYFVDNNSNDDTVQILKTYRQKFINLFGSIQIYNRPNLGFGSGHNYAISQCKNNLFLVSNIDLEFSHNSLLNIITHAINDTDDVACWELRQKPYEHPKYFDPVTLETAWNSHACILIRKDVYLSVGGYEPRIFMYGEDVELSYRFRQHGYILKYIPSAFVYHYTYSEANEIKPLQFSGSTLANTLIRFRYGTIKDKLVGVMLQFLLLAKGGGFNGSRKLVFLNLIKLIIESKYFLNKSDNSVFFPFRYFDYEMIRDGAFYKLEANNTPVNDLPLVTIITRTFQGREFYLRECVTSVINQTYPNIQHVIIEDGGNTFLELIEQIKTNYGEAYNVKFSGFEKKGRSFSGNQGLKIADGKYCLFLDDDDLIFPDHIEVLVNGIEKQNSLGAVYSLAWDVHTKLNKENIPQTYSEHHFETLPLFYQEFCLDRLLNYNYMPIQSVLFKRSLFLENGGFDESMEQLEDWNLWTKYALQTDFGYIPKTTSLFRTPYSIKERLSRSKNLDESYETALMKQKQLIIGYK